jgi:hypothetical protein
LRPEKQRLSGESLSVLKNAEFAAMSSIQAILAPGPPRKAAVAEPKEDDKTEI